MKKKSFIYLSRIKLCKVMVAMEAYCDVAITMERDFRETHVRPDVCIAILLLKLQKTAWV